MLAPTKHRGPFLLSDLDCKKKKKRRLERGEKEGEKGVERTKKVYQSTFLFCFFFSFLGGRGKRWRALKKRRPHRPLLFVFFFVFYKLAFFPKQSTDPSFAFLPF